VYWYCHRQQFLATVAGHKIGRYSTSVLYVQWDWMKDGKAIFVRPPKNRKELKSKKNNTAAPHSHNTTVTSTPTTTMTT